MYNIPKLSACSLDKFDKAVIIGIYKLANGPPFLSVSPGVVTSTGGWDLAGFLGANDLAGVIDERGG